MVVVVGVVGSQMGRGWVDITMEMGVVKEENGEMRGWSMKMRCWCVKGNEKEKERKIVIEKWTENEGIEIGIFKSLTGKDTEIINTASSIDSRRYMAVIVLLHLKDQV
jgi:hypothetical protein